MSLLAPTASVHLECQPESQFGINDGLSSTFKNCDIPMKTVQIL
jgi:hypothetical protein